MQQNLNPCESFNLRKRMRWISLGRNDLGLCSKLIKNHGDGDDSVTISVQNGEVWISISEKCGIRGPRKDNSGLKCVTPEREAYPDSSERLKTSARQEKVQRHPRGRKRKMKIARFDYPRLKRHRFPCGCGKRFPFQHVARGGGGEGKI